MSLQSIYEKRKSLMKETGKFIKLENGESLTGVFQDVEEANDIKFGAKINFKFSINGMDKVYSRSATGPGYALVNEFIRLGISEGDTVKLTKLPTVGKEASKFLVEKLSNNIASEPTIQEERKEDELAEIDRIFKK